MAVEEEKELKLSTSKITNNNTEKRENNSKIKISTIYFKIKKDLLEMIEIIETENMRIKPHMTRNDGIQI